MREKRHKGGNGLIEPLQLQAGVLALNTTDHSLSGVLGDNLVIVEHSKLLGSITTHEVVQGVCAAGVLIYPVSEIEDDALDHDPKILLGVVLGDFLHGVLGLWDLEVRGIGLGGGGLGGSGSGSSGGSESGQASAGGGTAPLDRDLAGRAGVDVEGDLAETLGGGGGAVGEELLEEVLGGRVTCDTAVDDTAEEGGTAETVGAVDAAGEFTAGVEAVEGLLLAVEDLGVLVDLDTTHGEVEDGLHESNVELVVELEGHVVEEALVPGVLLLAVGDEVVLVEGLLKGCFAAADFGNELGAGHLLHQAAAGVVTGVEVQDLGGLAVEDETDGPLALLLFFPHLAGDVVAVAELVGEALAVGVEEETTFTAKGFGSQELELGAWVLGVDETGGVDLNLVHVDAVGADGHQHLLAVTGSVGAVGGGQTEGVGAVLLEEGGVTEVSGVTTGSENDDTVGDLLLAVDGVGNTGDIVTGLVDGGDVGLLDDLDTTGLTFGEIFQSLHQGVGDGHTGELGVMATVCAGVSVSTETGDESEVEVEDILQPLDGGGGLVGQDLDQVRTGLVTGRLESIFVELLDTVLDAEIGLGASESTVDTGGGLGRVTTEESLLIQNEDVATVEVDGVCGAEARDWRGSAGDRERMRGKGYPYGHHRPQLLEVQPLCYV